VTKHHADECKQLLSLMGIPYIEVSSELKSFDHILCDFYEKGNEVIK
jgi:hypothetical protein